VTELSRIVQMPNETVSAYAARLISTVGQLRPTAPSPMKMVVEKGIRTPKANPNYLTEKAKYDGQVEQLEVFLISHFMTGLRADLKKTMKPEQYIQFAQCRKSATDAENHLIAQGLFGVNSVVEQSEGATGVNAVYGKHPTLNKLEKGTKDKSQAQCYRCKRYGHYARDCRTQLPTDTDQSARGQPTGRRPTGQNPRGQYPRSRGYGTGAYNAQPQQRGQGKAVRFQTQYPPRRPRGRGYRGGQRGQRGQRGRGRGRGYVNAVEEQAYEGSYDDYESYEEEPYAEEGYAYEEEQYDEAYEYEDNYESYEYDAVNNVKINYDQQSKNE